MNKHLWRLADLMRARHGTQLEELVDALFLIRAPRHLAAIVWCCERLMALYDTCPELKDEPPFPDQAARLQVLRQVAQLREADTHFMGATIDRNRRAETPLRPYTGDSGLCDVLLLLPGQGASNKIQEDYSRLLAWFAWQMFYYQARLQSPKVYEDYLSSDKDDLRLTDGRGSRVYGASRLVRELADTATPFASALMRLLRGPGVENAVGFTRLLMYSLNAERHEDLGASLLITFEDSEVALAAAVKEVRTLNSQLGTHQGKARPDLSLLRPFLFGIWGQLLDQKPSQRRREALDRLSAEGRKLDVRRYAGAIAEPQLIETGDASQGLLIDLHPWKKSVPEENTDSADDPEETPVEPPVQLYLGQGDPIAAWYAAKSAAHHVEAGNALLRWPHWRLSEDAIKRVAQAVEAMESSDPALRWARLVVGLSLITGRSFEAVARVRVGSGLAQVPDQLTVDAEGYWLVLPVARPDLKQDAVPGAPARFCRPWEPCLRLPLPQSWRPLIGALASQQPMSVPETVSACRRLLESAIPGADRTLVQAGVTEKGICHALQLAILESTRDDLGVLKQITDTEGLNLRNIIHYSSSDAHDLASRWREIVSRWIPGFSELEQGSPGVIVGAPHGIDTRQIRDVLSEIRARFGRNVATERWDIAYNQLTVYCVLWLGLGTAGRGTSAPVPEWIDEEGWALVRDKHRPDESTDRYVPLSVALRSQLEILRSLASALGIAHPDVLPNAALPGLELSLFKHGGAAQAYRPRAIDGIDLLAGLPRNWGRRLVRSIKRKLPGRMIDTGVGHWVRGRHPWSCNSTFPSVEFRNQWLDLQADLERIFGFVVLQPPGLEQQGNWKRKRSPILAVPSREVALPVACGQREPWSADRCEDLIKRHCSQLEFHAVLDSHSPSPHAVRALAEKVITREMARCENVPLEVIQGVCRCLRERTGVPLFATRPPLRSRRNWMVSQRQFAAHVLFTPDLLAAITKDLSGLPVRREEISIRVGRLIAAMVSRAGILDVWHIDAALRYLASEAPIEAVGEARMMELHVRSRLVNGEMRRTILLEPYLAALLAVERPEVRQDLVQMCGHKAFRVRNTIWMRCWKQYLAHLRVDSQVNLRVFLDAMRQRLMLRTTPLLAAYASGELYTHDLRVNEFRRLTGLEPLRGPRSAQLRAAHDKEASDMPTDLLAPERNLAQELAAHRGSDTAAWIHAIQARRRNLADPRAILLAEFALYMLSEHARQREGNRIGRRMPGILKDSLNVIWAGLMGFSELAPRDVEITPRSVDELYELTDGYFPQRVHHGAWRRFRGFLSARGGAKQGGGRARAPAEGPNDVSAKILSRAEQLRIYRALGSIASGIAKPANRRAARMHFVLAASTGARRAEVEMMRWQDVDGDMLHVREYDGHTLKTVASRRVVPKALVPSKVWDTLERSRHEGSGKLIDVAPGENISGYNFFDKVGIVMKQVTGDPDIGLHHLRHTKASLLCLAMLSNTVKLDRLDPEFEWLQPSLLKREEVDTLLGSAGQCGQGLQAIARLLGHQHESTTLRHYVHTLNLALHAHFLSVEPIPIHKAFYARLHRASGLYADARKYPTAVAAGDEQARRLRSAVEASVRRRHRETSRLPGAVRPEGPARIDKEPVSVADRRSQRASELFARYERLHHHLTGQVASPVPEAAALVAENLRSLATVATGKRGSNARRHPLPIPGENGVRLPDMILAGLPVTIALTLLAWLEQLREERPEDEKWLCEKWMYATHSQSGAMRLDGAADVTRAKALDGIGLVRVLVRPIFDTASRRRGTSPTRYEMLLGFDTVVGRNSAKTSSAPGRRVAGAVRWAMTWFCVDNESAGAGGDQR